MTSITPRMGALVLAWALGVYGVLGGLPLQPAHELHLGLAHHALGSLTNLWSAQWDLGHSFAGHPPLLHQLISLLARVPMLGLERAYAVSMALVPVLLTFAMGWFVERLESRKAGDIAAWLTAANPLCFLFLFPFGQAPFLAGTALALMAGASWHSAAWGARAQLAGAFFAVAAVSTHAAAVVPLAVVGGLALCSKTLSARWRVGVVASALGAAVLAAVALAPFLREMLANPITPSSKLFGTSSLTRAMVWGCIAWSAVVSLGLGGWQGRWLGAGLIALAAMSLTHAPIGVAGDKWLWLAAAFSPVGWALASERGAREMTPRQLSSSGLLCVLTLLVISSYVLGGSSNDGYGHRNTALREARLVLEQPGSESYRYLTLDVGAARFELARRVRAPSLDTGLPWVAASALEGTGFVNIDELPLAQPAGVAALTRVLARADELHLRWVLCGDSKATPVLKAQGFELRSAWKGDLTLWERATVSALGPPTPPPDSRSWVWAFMPLTTLALAGAFAPWRHRERGEG